MRLRSALSQLLNRFKTRVIRLGAKLSGPFGAKQESFQASYITAVLRKIEKGSPHATLGGNISNSSKQDAVDTFNYLASYLRAPSDMVVDYGCGTLRVGRHFIKSLNTGQYTGMDLDERILDAGASLLSEQDRAKSPVLLLINEENLERVAQQQAQLVFCQEVLHHVPPSELVGFFQNLAKIGQKAAIVVGIKRGPITKRISKRSWTHQVDDVINAAKKGGLSLINDDQRWLSFKIVASAQGRPG